LLAFCRVLTNEYVASRYLDPGEEDHDGHGRVEAHLPVAERLEVHVLVGVGQQVVEDVVDGDRAVDVETDAADGHDDHHDVQDVPERLEVRQSQLLDLFSTTYRSMLNSLRRRAGTTASCHKYESNLFFNRCLFSYS